MIGKYVSSLFKAPFLKRSGPFCTTNEFVEPDPNKDSHTFELENEHYLQIRKQEFKKFYDS
jgi:hypothetical protein